MTRELKDLKCLLETLEIEQKDGLKFANINVEGLYNDFIMNDKGFFTMDELDKFKKYLNLTGQETKEELRAIRNTIVKYYSDHVEEYYNKDFATFDKFQDQMSAFTGMIDYLMMDMNESKLNEKLDWTDAEFCQKMLGRLVQDCKDYINDPSTKLWAGSIAEQISLLKRCLRVVGEENSIVNENDIDNLKSKMIKVERTGEPLDEDFNLDQTITKLRNNIFIPNSQKDIIFQYLNNDEAEHYINIINNLDEVIKNSPNLYDTDGKKDKKPILHYFYGSYDAYALELDKQTGEMFGYVSMGYEYELGYFSMDEINTVPQIELDLYFNGKLPKEINESYTMNEISDELANEFLRRRVQNAVNANYEDEELNRKEERAVTALIKRKRRQGKPLTDDEKEYLEKNESYKKQPNDFQKALDLIKFGKNKKDKTTYENYLNSFEREGKLNLFTNYCFDKGLKISDIKPETILEDKQKETPYIIYGKTKEQKTFKAMDMNKGVQVNNLIRATLIYEPKDKLEGYVEELKKENKDWEFKFKKA